jgi:rRNA small subunit pseudouridine methyltransferase Nep1
MTPLTIILADCGLELIPKHIRKHSAVQRNLSSKNYSSQLLDNALHHSAMKNLKDSEKRGRPDILHACLLNALGSPLNKSGKLNLFVHTFNDKIFKFNPELRIARNFNRFKGLMAKVLIDGDITANRASLITQIDVTVKDLIERLNKPEIILFSRKGKLVKTSKEMFPDTKSHNYIAIIGGFQKGGFSEEILSLTDNLISISKHPLDAWNVVGKVITYYEIELDII